MNKKKLFGMIGGALLLTYGAIIITVNVIDINPYRANIMALAADATGRTLDLEGDLSLSLSLFSLSPSLTAESIHFSNSDWASTADMLFVERVEVQVALLPLLWQSISVKHVLLEGINVSLEQDANGTANWELALATTEEALNDDSESATPNINLKEFIIRDLELNYVDQASNTTNNLKISELQITKARRDLLALSLSLAYQDNEMALDDISLNGTFGNINTLMANEALPIDLTLALLGLETSIQGQVEHPLEGTGVSIRIQTKSEDLSTLGGLLETDLASFQPLLFSGAISDQNNAYQLNDLAISFSSTNLSGSAEIDISGALPQLTAAIDVESFDLRPFESESTEEVTTDRMFSTDALPLDSLNALNVDFDLAIGSLLTTSADLKNINSKITLQNGRLDINPFTANVGNGDFKLQLILDNTTDALSLSLDIDAKAIELGAVTATSDKIQGAPTNVLINLYSHGNTLAELAALANGSILVEVGVGTIVRENRSDDGTFLSKLITVLNPLSKQQNSALECVVINMDIDDGMVTANNSIGLESALLKLVANGQINLKTEEMDFDLESAAQTGFNLEAIASMVSIRGTLAEPSVGANVKNLAGASWRIGRETFTTLRNGFTRESDIATASNEIQPCMLALNPPPPQTAPAPQAEPEPEKKPGLINRLFRRN